MRCKKHLNDLSSSAGVCASCLRERLLSIIASQSQPRQEPNKPDPPPPLSFPRSVSPYISRRRSDTAAHHRFLSTPQVGPAGSITAGIKKSRTGRFASLLSSLFRSKPVKPESDPGPADSWSPAWFSGSRKKNARMLSADQRTAAGGRPRTCRNLDRGMSPVRYADDEGEHCGGYSSERRTPARWGAAVVHSKSISGFTVCLSPMVRASPNRKWNQKGVPQEMVVTGGEFRVPAKPHLSTAPSFCKNRSRKLADFGRYSYDPTR